MPNVLPFYIACPSLSGHNSRCWIYIQSPTQVSPEIPKRTTFPHMNMSTHWNHHEKLSCVSCHSERQHTTGRLFSVAELPEQIKNWSKIHPKSTTNFASSLTLILAIHGDNLCVCFLLKTGLSDCSGRGLQEYKTPCPRGTVALFLWPHQLPIASGQKGTGLKAKQGGFFFNPWHK